MYRSDIGNLDLKCCEKSRAIPGFRRYALFSKHEYGLLVGDFNSMVKFGFVVYNPGMCNPEGIRVELKLLVPEVNINGVQHWMLKDIDPNFIKGLLDGMDSKDYEFKQSFRVDGDIGYFRGFHCHCHDKSLGTVLACTNAAHFLDFWGDVLATVLYGKGNVKTLKDAYEVNDLLISVNAFASEMSSDLHWGTANFSKDRAQKMYDELKGDLAKVEAEMNCFYENLTRNLNILAEYGISEEHELDYK